MKTRILDAAALEAISPMALVAYAQTEGWKAIEAFGQHSRVFQSPDGREEAIIPGTAKLGDYLNVVAELLAVFSRAEDRDELQVYRDLSTADKDIVRVKNSDAEDDGSVRIESGVELVVNSRNMLRSAACSAWYPQPTYRAGRVKLAENYMSKVRLGQTEHGSFVVTLLAPVPPAIRVQGSLFQNDDNVPYERLVTQCLSSGLDAAAAAIEQQNLGNYSEFLSAVPQGLSANLCEATAKLADSEKGVELSISWARTRPSHKLRWTRYFSRTDGEMLQEVARYFYEMQPRPDEHIVGFVVELQSTNPVAGGTVTIHTLIDAKYTSIKSQLAAPEYAIAIEAHEKKQPVSAFGTLVRDGKRWKLDNPTNFRMLPAEEWAVDEP